MPWLAFFIAVTLVGLLGAVVNVNKLRFAHRLASETNELVQVPATSGLRTESAQLPQPVVRYRQLAVGNRGPVGTLHLRHGGTFAMSRTSKPLPIRGTQVFTSDPPGFIWHGRIRMGPGVWVDARDLLIGVRGSMRVLLDDTVTIADVRGSQIDQGSAVRLLSEMVWFPTALFDSRYVTWTAIDDSHARATLRLGELQVSGEFGSDGLPIRMTAERPMDKGELKPWEGVYRSFRSVSGMLVPFEAEVSWQLESGTFTYAHWLVESAAYDRVEAIDASQ